MANTRRCERVSEERFYTEDLNKCGGKKAVAAHLAINFSKSLFSLALSSISLPQSYKTILLKLLKQGTYGNNNIYI